MGDPQQFVWQMLPTDCDFGPDGAFYWQRLGRAAGTSRARAASSASTDPEAMKNPAVAEAKKLLAEGFEKKSIEELAKLLEHPHQQVRQEAQYELARARAGRWAVRKTRRPQC